MILMAMMVYGIVHLGLGSIPMILMVMMVYGIGWLGRGWGKGRAMCLVKRGRDRGWGKWE